MAKKELKTEVKRLRLTELEAKQLEKYLDDHDLKFSEFVNALIGQKVMSNFQLCQPNLWTFPLRQEKARANQETTKSRPSITFSNWSNREQPQPVSQIFKYSQTRLECYF